MSINNNQAMLISNSKTREYTERYGKQVKEIKRLRIEIRSFLKALLKRLPHARSLYARLLGVLRNLQDTC